LIAFTPEQRRVFLQDLSVSWRRMIKEEMKSNRLNITEYMASFYEMVNGTGVILLLSLASGG
jgi:hypothetical protein